MASIHGSFLPRHNRNILFHPFFIFLSSSFSWFHGLGGEYAPMFFSFPISCFLPFVLSKISLSIPFFLSPLTILQFSISPHAKVRIPRRHLGSCPCASPSPPTKSLSSPPPRSCFQEAMHICQLTPPQRAVQVHGRCCHVAPEAKHSPTVSGRA